MSKLLSPNDTIAIVSPSIVLSPRENINIDLALKYFEDIGLKVLLVPSALTGLSLTSSSDIDKSKDIMEMYKNPEVKALVAVHGGASSLRVLEHLDYDIIRKNPKPIIGFSDTTSIQLGIYSQTGNPYITGFLPEYDFRKGHIDSLVDYDFKNIINGQKFSTQSGETIHAGIAKGKLVGGNLSILSDLNGTPYYPNIKDAILLIEDECETPYKIGLMLTQLRYNPRFKDVKAIVFGQFSECEHSTSTHGDVDYIIEDFARQVNKPIIKNFAYGHFPRRHVMTMGVDYQLDAENCCLEQL